MTKPITNTLPDGSLRPIMTGEQFADVHPTAASIVIACSIGAESDWNVRTSNDIVELVDRVLDGSPNTPLDVFINSPGGSARDCMKIYQRLEAHQGKVTITIGAMAAGGALWIAMAGDVVRAHPDSILGLMGPGAFTHDGMSEAELARVAADLDEIEAALAPAFLARKTWLTREDLYKAMHVETWMNGEEALRVGLIDELVPAERAAA